MYRFRIANMKCMGCFNGITKVLEESDQNVEVSVELKEKVITIVSQLSKEQLTKLIRHAGFEVEEVS